MTKVIRQDSKERILGNKSYVGDQEIIGKFTVLNSANGTVFFVDPDNNLINMYNTSGVLIFSFDTTNGRVLNYNTAGKEVYRFDSSTSKLQMKKTDGTVVFEFDASTGKVTITGGNITIKDEDDLTVIDSKGLVSTTNFVSDSVENSTGRSYSNTATYVDIADTSITTASLDRSTEVLIIYTLNVVEFPINGTTAFAGKVTLRIDSTDQTNNNFELQLASLSPIANASAWGGPLTASGIVTLASGTHTLKLRAQTINTNSQLNVETTSVAYIILGK